MNINLNSTNNNLTVSTNNKTNIAAENLAMNLGMKSTTGKISNIEVRRAGQAFQLGRYPIHFHMSGIVDQSFVNGNSIHNTYNRAVTIHGVHYLTFKDNVIYRCMGHSVFIEDGIETYNLIQNNLVINTMASWSLLNTDHDSSKQYVDWKSRSRFRSLWILVISGVTSYWPFSNNHSLPERRETWIIQKQCSTL